MKRLLTLGLIAPLAAAGALSVSSAASAAIFDFSPTINQLNFGVSFDITGLQLQRVAPGTVPEPNPLNLIIKPGTFPSVDFLPPVGGTTAPITISVINSGGIGFTICNSPAAGPSSASCTPATIQDFPVNGLTVNPFIIVNGANGSLAGAPGTNAAGLKYEFSLDTSKIVASLPNTSVVQFQGSGSGGSCVVNPGQVGCKASIDFTALGKLKITGIPADPAFAGQLGKEYDVNYSYSGPLLNVDSTSTSCGLTVGSMCSINFDPPTTGAGNLQVTISPPVPEPGTVGALLGLGVIGSFGALKRKKLGK